MITKCIFSRETRSRKLIHYLILITCYYVFQYFIENAKKINEVLTWNTYLQLYILLLLLLLFLMILMMIMMMMILFCTLHLLLSSLLFFNTHVKLLLFCNTHVKLLLFCNTHLNFLFVLQYVFELLLPLRNRYLKLLLLLLMQVLLKIYALYV